MRSPIHILKFSALLAICETMEQALDLEAALDGVLCMLSEKLSMQRATVTLYDPEIQQLAINASYGLTLEEKRRGVYRLDEGVTGKIFRSSEPFYVPDISNNPLFLDKTGARKLQRRMTSFIGVPIVLHGDPIGVLNVDRVFDDHISIEEDIDFLKIVATLIGQFLSLNKKVMEREAVFKRENASLRYQISQQNKGLFIVGKSPAMMEVQRQMERVSPTRATVLLLGESGVGKTLIARIIHDLSDRKGHPFVKINCASIPENLLEAEFFGYEKGAFTGAASSRQGRFEEADCGTIFMDEIGELPLNLQAKLLRVLQEKEFERLGSNKTRTVDIRIIAATNKDLAKLVEQNEFRLDLYYRLNIFPIVIPALCERREDVTGLLNHFLRKAANNYGRTVSLTAGALDALIQYDWPGNVREMENLIERLVIMSDSDYISFEFIAPFLGSLAVASETGVVEVADVSQKLETNESLPPQHTSLQKLEQHEIIQALRSNDWIQYKAAATLGLTPRQMGYRVKRYHLEEVIAVGRARLRNK
ncbi:sigma 54-interacting transcriptional regulator [Halodesulfovibrio sp. MK-HDV]|uniref:sigma 54-interacting transcriptional regulator n=1 Tax=unclassified Halodesulfovibrio TaxID=2644657 RepID=UPI00136E37B3|nr:sigma 54-interacting transcriptional regulator [Halodesulfovibrio sp. MK-HDV]KAF1077088.1 Nitrogen fixation protein VnfA [Halodesulfovibrio sp. MK-HDV]